jgi:hypothetical protein
VILVATAQAAFLGGVAFVPMGAGVYSWDEIDGWSDTLAAEWDGWIRPPLTAHAGWVGSRHAWLGNAALVEWATSSWADEERHFSVGGLRLGADWRSYLWARQAGKVNAWPTAGLFGIVPFAGDTDSGWNEEEQAQADEDNQDRRARIGGLGLGAGLGFEYPFPDKEGKPGVILGARWLTRGFGGLDAREEEVVLSMLWTTEAAILLEFSR